jgi:beta-aspartyl-dipeptidase (metallo-type)
MFLLINFCRWTGGYRVPIQTVTGDIEKDITLIQEIIGVGELAISDHRSSHPTFDELTRIVGDSRVAGLLAGKAGKVHFHVGAASSKIDLLWDIVKKTPIPITQLYPTHMAGRGQALIDEGKLWIKEGGYLDFTADDQYLNETETTQALLEYLKYV